MVMLTLANAIVEKVGGDTMNDIRDGLARYRERISGSPDAPVAGGRRGRTPKATPHGLTGTDEAGAGGDD